MKTRIVLIVMLGLVGLSGKGQVTFQKTYGGIQSENGNSGQQTFDGGYIIGGSTYSYDSGNWNVYLVKTDSFGNTLWSRTYGNIGADYGYFVEQTLDSGYIITGYSNSWNTTTNFYLIKTKSNGDILWSKTYTGPNYDGWANSVQQTTDGGYIITGTNAGIMAGSFHVYLIKTNPLGDIIWTKTYGGNGQDYGQSVKQTTDGGYIIVGWTTSFGAGSYDIYVIKTNANGDTLWTKTYGGINEDEGYSIQQTTDGGYIIGGYSWCFPHPYQKMYLIKTDSIGDTLWTKVYGGQGWANGYYAEQTNDGGYIFAGQTNCFDSTGWADILLIKVNSNGNVLWSKNIGGTTNHSYVSAVHQTTDRGFVIIGSTRCFGVGHQNIYLIKTDSMGNVGCHEQSVSVNEGSTQTQITNPNSLVSSGGTAYSTTSIVGSGCIETTLCQIITNTNEIKSQHTLLVSPNPFTTFTTLTLQGSYHCPTLYIYNLMGQEVRSLPIGSNKQVTIPRNQLPAGMYFYKVIEDNKEVLGVGKFIISDF